MDWWWYHVRPSPNPVVDSNPATVSRDAGSRAATTDATLTTAEPGMSLGVSASVRCRVPRKLTRRTVSAGAVPGTPATLARPETASGREATAASMAAGSLRSH